MLAISIPFQTFQVPWEYFGLFAQIVLNLLWKHEKAKTNNVCLNVILVMCFFYVNTIPHRLVVHVYFYVYLNVVHEGFESVILLVLQIILVPLNSISSAFLVSRCKGSSYFRARSPLVRFNCTYILAFQNTYIPQQVFFLITQKYWISLTFPQ